MHNHKRRFPSSDATGPAFDRRTTRSVAVAIENKIALLDAEIVRVGSSDPEQKAAFSNERKHLQDFFDDYVSKTSDYHQRMAYISQRRRSSLWNRLSSKLKLILGFNIPE